MEVLAKTRAKDHVLTQEACFLHAGQGRIWLHRDTLSPFLWELNANRSAAGNHGNFSPPKQGSESRAAEVRLNAGSAVKVKPEKEPFTAPLYKNVYANKQESLLWPILLPFPPKRSSPMTFCC